MPAHVRSVNVGSAGGAGRPTGINKVPVAAIDVAEPGPKRVGPRGVGFSGVVGDFIGSGQHHGGSAQAVYAVAREELDFWAAELGHDLADGTFGENITTSNLDVDAGEIGDRWHAGSAVLRVMGPRMPCATFATRMGAPLWLKRFSARGRTGAYLGVDSAGRISPGDVIEVVPSGSGITVPMLFRGWMGDVDVAREVYAAGVLGDAEQAELAAVIARRT